MHFQIAKHQKRLDDASSLYKTRNLYGSASIRTVGVARTAREHERFQMPKSFMFSVLRIRGVSRSLYSRIGWQAKAARGAVALQRQPSASDDHPNSLGSR
jgi:hypothetical protein